MWEKYQGRLKEIVSRLDPDYQDDDAPKCLWLNRYGKSWKKYCME
jgi:hypothetical protein